jgi:hypothetical protein
LGDVLKLEINPEALAFIESREYVYHDEPWWPGDSSPFREIHHLIPNHILDLGTSHVKRYWPRNAMVRTSPNEVVGQVCQMLRNLLKGVSQRHQLAMAITAGWDSRVLLAASREISAEVLYYTLLYPPYTFESRDIHIPSKLLSKLQLRHEVYDCAVEMKPEFAEVYNQSVFTAHSAWGNIAQGLLRHFPEDHLAVKGNVSEAARCFYHKHVRAGESITGATLARITKMGRNQFVVKHFASWLEGAKESAQYGMDILDIFYLEQRMGNWQAMSQLEWDLVQEVFTPFNCRSLIELLLSVDYRLRCAPRYVLYRQMIQSMWKETLQEPVNPKVRPFSARLYWATRDVLLRTDLIRPVRRLVSALRRLKKGSPSG